MGLTIHYTLQGPPACDARQARGFVEKFHATALGFLENGRVRDVGLPAGGAEDLAFCSDYVRLPEPEGPDGPRHLMVEPEEGSVFQVDLGEGCESLQLGLCRYPTKVWDEDLGRAILIRKSAWRMSSFCKTQYASVHGMEHFLRCHTTAVALLDAWIRAGGRAKISDEGGYWPACDTAELRGKVERMNRIVAGLAGYLKDRSSDSGSSTIQSPIFEHPLFEHLEAEGRDIIGDVFQP